MVYGLSGLLYFINRLVIYSSGRILGKGVLRRSIIAATIIIISYIFANRLERYSTVAGLLGVGAGNSNGLADSNIFRNLLLYFSFTVDGGSIIYIFNYILISGGMGASGYWV